MSQPQAPQLISCEVDSYHINCGVGDCAIHIVVGSYNNNTSAIIRAVLIDGGLSTGEHVLKYFQKTVEDIEARNDRYGLHGAGLKFDTVVITHWDLDHYGGIQLLLQNALEKNLLKKVGDDYQFPMFWYDYTKTPPRRTYVYAPNSDVAGKITFDEAEGTMGFTHNDNEYNNLALARWGEGIIGHELFNAQGSTDGDAYKAIHRLQDLVLPNQPGMYCLAANKHIIGRGKVGRGWPYKMKARPDQTMHNEGITETNQESILAIIAWKNAQQQIHVSHYFGGDIHARSECWVADWLARSGVDSITCMKASHHGARTSNPPLLLTQFKPKRIVVSAKDKHGHPSWQLLAVVLAYVMRQRAVNPTLAAPCVFTCFPSWLLGMFTKHGIPIDNINVDAMCATEAISKERKAKAKHYVDMLKFFYGDELWLKSPIRDLHLRLNKTKGYDQEEVFQNIAEVLFQEAHHIWQDLWADLEIEGYQPDTNPTQYVGLTLTHDPATDGKLFLRDTAAGLKDVPNKAPAETDTVINTAVGTLQATDFATSIVAQPLPAPDVFPDNNNGDESAEESDPDEDDPITGKKKKKKDKILNPRSYGVYQMDPPRRLTRAGQRALDEKETAEMRAKEKALAQKGKYDPIPDKQPPFQLFSMAAFHPAELRATEVRMESLEALDTTLPAQPDGPFAIMSKQADVPDLDKLPTLTPAHRILRERDDAAFDSFTCGLLGMTLDLARAPSAEGAALDSKDMLSLFLDLALKAKLTIHGSPSALTELRIQAAGMTFSTSKAAEMIGADDADVNSLGLSTWTENTTMVFGLLPQSETSVVGTGDLLAMLAADNASSDQVSGAMLIAEVAKPLLNDVSWTLSTTKGSRNGIWLSPGSRYLTVVRLEYQLAKESGEALNKFLASLLDSSDALVISDVALIFKKTCRMESRPSGNKGLSSVRSAVLVASVSIKSVNLKVSVELVSQAGLTLKVWTEDQSADFGELARSLLGKKVPAADTSFRELSSGAGLAKDETHLWFRRLVLSFDTRGKFTNARLAMEVNAQLGRFTDDPSVPGQNVAVLLEGGYSAQTASKWSLSGRLWFRQDYAIPFPLWSEWERRNVFQPVTKDAAHVLLLSNLLPGDPIQIPAGIPNAVTKAEFFVNGKEMTISGTISNCRHAAEDGSDVPTLSLDEVNVDAAFGWSPKYLSLSLRFRLGLNLPVIEGEDLDEHAAETQIIGAFTYDSRGSWSISGGIKDLNLGQLYGFFQDDLKDALYDLLKGINVKQLTFQYVKESDSTVFISQCQMMLGQHESITLHYTYRKGGNWKFYAALGSDRRVKQPVTLGSILTSLSGSESSMVADLPSFLTDLTILSPESKPLKFEITVTKSKKEGVKLQASMEIASFAAEFVQLTAPDAKNGGNTTRRMFKAVLKDINMPTDVPLLSTMEKPFDELGFMWLNQDMTADQLSELDSNMVTESSTGEKVASFKSGFHFMVVAKKSLVLDYPIGGGKNKSGASASPRKTGSSTKTGEAVKTGNAGKTDSAGALTPASPGQSNKAKYSKTIGPLTISNIGCKYAEDTLSILMDATFAFGPVSLDLFGFTLGLHFKGGLKKPSSAGDFFSNIDVKVSISGLGVEFNKPPLAIAGAFLYEKQGKDEFYAGGLTVGFSPWLFKAAGMYGTIELTDDQKLKCFFMYAMLRGPIMSFGFADVSGLTAGFGYNIDITLPTVDMVTQFPLLAPGQAKPPRETIRELLPQGSERSPYFNPLDGARWLAAGLTVTAFQMLEVTALVVVQWSPHVQLAILGMAVCDIPSPKAPVKFAHIELGILATVDLQGGVFKVEAQLTPNSYILHPSCHLTGGFALYYWFKSERSAVEGDWVCTMGGYHSAFAVPAHYPKPDRLRISWSLNDNLSILGEAYFAITPKVCMGGVQIRALLSLGPLRAWFNAYADFLIGFAPFHFQAVVHVSVGVAFSMRVWFVTVNIAVEIGATLQLAGPPFRGNVHVDFWVFGFDIAFGDHSAPDKEPLTVEQFYDLVMQADTPPKDGEPKLPHLLSCQKGLLTDGKQEAKASDPWLVRGGVFEFAVSAYFAIGELYVNDMLVTKPENVADIYARPMKTGSTVDSRCDITITRDDGSAVKGWTISPTAKSVPQGIWGAYSDKNDPSKNGNSIDTLLSPDGGTSLLMMGLVLEGPQPKPSKDTMPQFIVEEAMETEVQYTPGKEPTFPRLPRDSKAWIPLPELDDSERDEGEPTQWEAVKSAWGAEAADPGPSVDLCGTVFGWTAKLKGAKPKRFIENLDKLCLKAPLLGVPKFTF